jgi:hypothetical protein
MVRLKRTLPLFFAVNVNWKSGGRDRDRTCDLIHAMDALSQLSYTPVTELNDLLLAWQTAIILTNIPMNFHRDA